eukprot:COSAG02_NODE_42_length_46522_cov_109.704478_28_plen_70_part_00
MGVIAWLRDHKDKGILYRSGKTSEHIQSLSEIKSTALLNTHRQRCIRLLVASHTALEPRGHQLSSSLIF